MADAFDDSPVVIAELPQIKLFGKWSSEDVNHSDMSLAVSLTENSMLLPPTKEEVNVVAHVHLSVCLTVC